MRWGGRSGPTASSFSRESCRAMTGRAYRLTKVAAGLVQQQQVSTGVMHTSAAAASSSKRRFFCKAILYVDESSGCQLRHCVRQISAGRSHGPVSDIQIYNRLVKWVSGCLEYVACDGQGARFV